MSDYVIPAIVFRVDNEIPVDDLKALMTDVKMRCRDWTGEGEYKAVLGFNCGKGHRGHIEVGATVPYDSAKMDQTLLDIPQLSSVKRYRQLDMIDGKEREKKWKTGLKKPKVPDVDLSKTRFGFDENKINSKFRYLLEPDAHEEGQQFADVLAGYPFENMSPAENKDYIEIEIIASLEAKFPLIYDANHLVDGLVVTGLQAIAEPRNQGRLPQHWHQAFARMFERGRHPGSIDVACRGLIGHFKMLDKLERDGRVKLQPKGIAARYTELSIERDHIVEAAEAFG